MLGTVALVQQIQRNRTPEYRLSPLSLLETDILYRKAVRKNAPVEKTQDAYRSLIRPVWITAAQYRRLLADYRQKRTGSLRPLPATHLTVIPDREFYFRHHLIKLIAFPEKGLQRYPLYAVLYKDGKPVTSGGFRAVAPFRREGRFLVARLNPGFGPVPGRYTAAVFAAGIPGRVYTVDVLVRGRIAKPLPRGFSVMTMESAIRMKYQRVRGPFRKYGSWKKLLEWADFLTADAFWILGSQASGNDRGISPANPFCRDTLRNIDLLGPAAKKAGLAFGAYIISFYTPHGGHLKSGYLPSMKYTGDGRFSPSLHTSLMSRRRIADMTVFASAMQRRKHVDYIGFDFIRTGHSDGFELVDHVVRDMHLPVPGDWGRRSRKSRMGWFASMVLVRKDRRVVDAWRWWRAHHVASLIGSIIRHAGVTKPVWVFTLGWEHGRQHGQDPYMMIDAGCTLDAAMLYEANGEQFDGMEKQWRGYLDGGQVNLITGNCVDWKLNRRNGTHPLVEFYRRSIRGLTRFSHNRRAAGLFWHDVARAVWGRTGGNSGTEWGIAGAAAATQARILSGRQSLELSLRMISRNPCVLEYSVKNRSAARVRGGVLRSIPLRWLPDFSFFQKIPALEPGAVIRGRVTPGRVNFREDVHIAGMRLAVPGEPDAVAHLFVRR